MSDATSPPAAHVENPLLSAPLRPTIFRLALPVLAEQFLNFCVGFYDVWLAGNLPMDVSRGATAAVGVAAYVGWLATMLFSLVSVGTTALVARARGRADWQDADRVANRSLALGAVGGMTFLAVIIPAAPWLAASLDMTEETAAITVRYLRIDAVGLLFSSVSFVGAAALRGCGNMRAPMWVLGTVSVLNIIVSTWLVYGGGPVSPQGVDGIVLGTVVARTAGGLLMLAMLARGISGLKLRWSEFRLADPVVRRVLRIGLPAGIEGMAMWAGHFLFLKIISSLGEAEFAAHTIGIRVEALTYLPAIAWGAASATIIGQSLGAGLPDRARQAGHEGVRQCAALGGVLTILYFAGAEPIFRQMHNLAEVRALGIPALRLLAAFQIPLVLAIVYGGGLRGAGDTRFPLWLTACSTFGVRLPLAYVCGIVLEGGLIGAWIGMCADMLIRGVVAAWRFHSDRWMKARV